MRFSMEQEFIRRRVQAMYNEVAVPLTGQNIMLDDEARKAFESALEQIADNANVARGEVARRLSEFMYLLDSSQTIVGVLALPETGNELFVEVPSSQWSFSKPEL
ncbi:hypothetical protein [Oleidesulfovibrio sp.]|uniref:hypothetical protein n=1 Tax=Oleidesulfovibrio sp. TaxID=2909707 RepID=UPI003A8574E4